MTENEFKTWDWHKAQNLESQRNNALTSVAEQEVKHSALLTASGDKIAVLNKTLSAILEERDRLLSEKDVLSAAMSGLQDQANAAALQIQTNITEIAEAAAKIKSLELNNAEVVAKVSAANKKMAAMKSHPEVMAATKTAEIKALRQKRIDAAETDRVAKEKLIRLGEPV